MTNISNPIPQAGQLARIRQRTYLVEGVSTADPGSASPVVRLSCVDDDAQGQPLEVLWQHEVDAEVMTGEAWDAIARRGFDRPDLFTAYLNSLRWNCVTATDPGLFQSPFRAGIRLDAYQLEPLRKALRLPRVNLFIADDVGLGKTIEAGLIARELLLRKKIREIVVCCPPSMLLQWKDELEARFGLTFEILDKDYITRVRRERGFGVNPWTTHTRFLISQRLLIDEAYVTPLRDWLGAFRSGTLLILDEAHHAAPSSGQKYAIDSQITRAVREVARCFEHRLFLSATPHNGHSNSFSALLEILDPQRFFRGMSVPAGTWKRLLGDVMVRRLKDDLREIVGGFPKRRVIPIDIDGLPASAPELRLAALLDDYRQLREQRLSGETRKRQSAAGLLVTGLQQRLLSSIEAFSRTLRVHRKTVLRHWEEAQKAPATGAPVEAEQLDLVGGTIDPDDDRAELLEEELHAEEELQIEAVTAATSVAKGDATAAALFSKEQKILDEMTAIAEASRGLPDARVRKLIDWIRTHMCPDLPQPDESRKGNEPWTDIRIIIFTEWDDTKRYLVQQLSAAIEGTNRADDRIAVYHGPTPVDERERIKRAFNADPSTNPLRILIATDAAREGLNLQAHCWNLFHADVPWNPSRMEQRNGRIDRKLQPNAEVFCHYFFYKQRPEDRVIAALVRKTETIKKELGSLGQVIDAKLHNTMSRGIQRHRVDAIEKEISTADLEAEARTSVDEELEASRERQDELREQIDRLRTRLDESKRNIGFDQEHFRGALSSALELMNAPALEPVGADGKAWQFPALDQRGGADPRWADTMDTLRMPREKDQKPWEWRNTSPIRPVVFDDPGVVTDEVVHLHLEHRVVQRLLGRFMAQGFVYDDLARACLAQSSDAVPRVVLLGRLCLYGHGAARLHEELIPVAARWTDPKIRREKLSPYARDAETRTLDLLDEAIRKPKGDMSDAVLKQLQASAPQDVTELLPHLQMRGEEYAALAERKLRDRGEAEGKDMRSILENQQKHIVSTVAKHSKDDPGQLRLKFSDDEVRQLDANKKYWSKRLAMIEQELCTEPTRIREVYEVKAKRVEPVGLIYLWPVTG